MTTLDRRRAALLGGGAGLVLHLWLLTAGDWSVFARRPHADFFDAQAAAWLGGHWWIPREVAGIEGIVIDGRTQIYFGPLPALLRLPVAIFGGADGRLTVVSMLLAAAIATWAAVRLVGQALARWPPPNCGTGGESFLIGVVALVVPSGTALAFLASRTLVYHEAEAWGAATALLAFSLVIDAVEAPSRRTVALAVTAATACALARVSVAVGPVAALALLATHRTWVARRATPHLLLPAVPLAAAVSVNLIRFGTALSLPLDKQVQSAIDPTRQAFFAANGSDFVNLRFLPTTLFHYFQPFGIRSSGWFPFVDFPPPGRMFAGATFDTVDRAGSAPATMPALTVLALVGVVLLVRPSSAGFRIAAIGGVVGVVPMLVFGYVAHRYQADVVPALVVLGACGVVAVLRMAAGAGRSAVVIGAGVLALIGIWTNVGLGLLQQRLWGPMIDQQVTRDFVADRLSIDRRLHLADPVVHRVDALPDGVGPGDYVVLGDCDAVYLETGIPVGFLPRGHWRAVERVGAEVMVRGLLRAGTRDGAVLADADDGGRRGRIILRRLGNGRARVQWDGGPEPGSGPSFRLEDDELEVVADPHVDELTVRIGDRIVLSGIYLGDGGPKMIAAERRSRPAPEVCRDLLRSAAI